MARISIIRSTAIHSLHLETISTKQSAVIKRLAAVIKVKPEGLRKKAL
jgi:hypothetical protein